MKFDNNLAEFSVSDDEVMEALLDADLELWYSEDRIVILKEYTSNHYFFLNWREDQFIISNLLEILPPQYKNNLYFLLVLNWDSGFLQETPMEINRVEKNSKICRKYVLHTDEDLLRVSLLQQEQIYEKKGFDFVEKFKSGLLAAENNLDSRVHHLVEGFFQMEGRYNKSDSKRYITNILKGNEES
jgi:hypothetical protein